MALIHLLVFGTGTGLAHVYSTPHWSDIVVLVPVKFCDNYDAHTLIRRIVLTVLQVLRKNVVHKRTLSRDCGCDNGFSIHQKQ